VRVKPCGLFIGRSTVDAISVVRRFPQDNEKAPAETQVVSAGGPALNAAITFSHLGGQAILFSTFGEGLFGAFARAECGSHGVEVIDRACGAPYDFPLSVIISSQEASSRCVINPPPAPGTFPAPTEIPLARRPDIIVLDQFEADAVASLTPMLLALGVPIVLDGGSWKPHSPRFLDLATIPVVSSHFIPPEGQGLNDTAALLSSRGYRQWAVTQGPQGVLYSDNGVMGRIAPVPVAAIDTLGAGDIFHGAFCVALASGQGFVPALAFANRVAAESCKHAGTRQWMSAAATF
jgi:sugar/nucleoside kinase (ribokinase family)